MASEAAFEKAVETRAKRYNATDSYGASERVRGEMRGKLLAVFMGPAGIGKNELQKKILALPDTRRGFVTQKIMGEVTRDKRKGETGIYSAYLNPKDPATQEKIIADLDNGEYVQGAFNKANRKFYATRPQNYPDAPVVGLIDIRGDEFTKLMQRGVYDRDNTLGLFMSAEDNHEWMRKLLARPDKNGKPLTHDEIIGRVREANESVGICVSPDDVIAGLFVCLATGYRDDGVIENEASQIISTRGLGHDDTTACGYARSMETFTDGMLTHESIMNGSFFQAVGETAAVGAIGQGAVLL